MKLEEVSFTQVGGLKTACIGRRQLVDLMVHRVHQFEQQTETDSKLMPMLIFSSNGQSISIANSDTKMRDLLNQADVLHADGQSVVSFSKYFSDNPIPERTATTDTFHDVPNFYTGKLRHFLLGGKQVVLEQCREKMQAEYDNFDVVGTHHGYFPLQDEEHLVNKINLAKPDVLWVGLGKPKEQLFCLRNKHRLNVPVMITCGGCYNFVSGAYKRAPQAFQSLGLEWLHRAFTEPRKLMWRYITTNPHAIFCVIKHRYIGD